MDGKQVKQTVEGLRSDLNKRQTFLGACAKFETLFGDIESKQPELLRENEVRESLYSFVSRVAVVLKTRYTDRGFWRAGKKVFLCGERCFVPSDATAPKDDKAKSLLEWKALADNELKDEDEPKPATRAPAIADESNRQPLTPAQLSPNEIFGLISAALSSANPSLVDPSTGSNPNNQGNNQSFQDIEDMLLELVMRQSEAEREETANQPASREARHNLMIKTIEEEGVVCSICQNEFKKGAKAKLLPCNHFFHHKCTFEWLERNNTCPLCRHPLPTEKSAYTEVDLERIRSRPTEKLPLYS